jgi:hypothetical protein
MAKDTHVKGRSSIAVEQPKKREIVQAGTIAGSICGAGGRHFKKFIESILESNPNATLADLRDELGECTDFLGAQIDRIGRADVALREDCPNDK